MAKAPLVFSLFNPKFQFLEKKKKKKKKMLKLPKTHSWMKMKNFHGLALGDVLPKPAHPGFINGIWDLLNSSNGTDIYN